MRVAVAGGGIQGVGTALELSARGIAVELFERRPGLMDGASRFNEGKIHLGFVYANDDTFATAELMVAGAMRFAPALRRWLETDPAAFLAPRPFDYAVHRGSLLNPDVLADRYRRIAAAVRRAARQPGADYFGVAAPARVVRLRQDQVGTRYSAERVAAAFATAEIAVDPAAVADRLERRVHDDPLVTCRTGTRVARAEPEATGVVVTADGRRRRFDHFVNCAWCGRLVLDRAAGLPDPPAWSFRRKRFLRLPPGSLEPTVVPTATVVLGGFGDVVGYADGSAMVSWYPVGCRGLSRALGMAPVETLAADAAAAVREGIRSGMARIVPDLARLLQHRWDGADLCQGVIYALGTSDVDDAASGLHRRHDVGVRSFGRYHTIDTGKYTLAPMFAARVADRIAGRVPQVLTARRVA